MSQGLRVSCQTRLCETPRFSACVGEWVIGLHVMAQLQMQMHMEKKKKEGKKWNETE